MNTFTQRPALLSLPGWICLIIAGLTGLAGLTPLHAQTEEHLLELRERTLSAIRGQSRNLDEAYLRKLFSLEKNLSERSQYLEAARVQTRKLELQNILDQDRAQGGSAPTTIRLNGTQAKLSGGVQLLADEPTLSDWKSTTSTASWDLFRLTPGNYEVSITYSVGYPKLRKSERKTPLAFAGPAGGTFSLIEDSQLLAENEDPLRHSVKFTGGWDIYKTESIGTLTVTRENIRLKLRVERILDGGLMRLRELTLRLQSPLTDSDSTSSTPSTPTDPEQNANTQPLPQQQARLALDTLRQGYQKELQQISATLNSEHRQSLRTALDTHHSKDPRLPGLRESVLQHIRHHEHAQDSLIQHAASLNAQHLQDTFPFETLQQAIYQNDQDNRGDRFLIRHDGEVYPIRLLFVECPAPLPSETSETTQYTETNKDTEESAEESSSSSIPAPLTPTLHSAYFDISPRQSGLLGNRAQAFTKEYLSTQLLTVHTQWEKDPEGYYYAQVYLPHLGDFAHILLARGLACATGKMTSPPTQSPQSYLTEVLAPLETQAKAQQRGGWAMQPSAKTAPEATPED